MTWVPQAWAAQICWVCGTCCSSIVYVLMFQGFQKGSWDNDGSNYFLLAPSKRLIRCLGRMINAALLKESPGKAPRRTKPALLEAQESQRPSVAVFLVQALLWQTTLNEEEKPRYVYVIKSDWNIWEGYTTDMFPSCFQTSFPSQLEYIYSVLRPSNGSFGQLNISSRVSNQWWNSPAVQRQWSTHLPCPKDPTHSYKPGYAPRNNRRKQMKQKS